MGLKGAGISLLCQEVRVWDALWMAGTPSPFEGKIGDEAREEWLKDPDRAPEGSLIRVAEATKNPEHVIEDPQEYE